MFRRSTWLHLRIPFSFFLLPVFLFALSVSANFNEFRLLIVFVALHLFLYPASNGYNSYFDKDEESIGGLKNPPKVTIGLYYTALLFDFVALVLGALISWNFVAMLLIYGLVSKAYSHPSIRLKKYPWVSWLVAGLFQGFFTFLMVYIGLNDFPIGFVFRLEVLIPAMLSSMILWGSYPMTQIYQHREDSRRGDDTLSIRLGIIGTFHFTAVFFSISMMLFTWFFYSRQESRYAIVFLMMLIPVLLFFLYWYVNVTKDKTKASYGNSMILNFLSSTCLNVFFIYYFLDKTHILDAL